MAISYENIYYDFVLDGIRDILTTEFTYGTVYISQEINDAPPFSIRLWGNTANTVEFASNQWTKEYFVEIDLYMVEKNPSEVFYKQLYNDAERIYQLLFNNNEKSITVGSVTNNWYDGEVSDMAVNDLTSDEALIDGLNKISFDFSCKVSRSS